MTLKDDVCPASDFFASVSLKHVEDTYLWNGRFIRTPGGSYPMEDEDRITAVQRQSKNGTHKPILFADRPITSAKEDVLGRHEFAEALSRALRRWSGKDSLVVALYGEWGSGKSSLKNLLLESLKKGRRSPTIIEFNPWEWSGRNNLFEAFFDEIGVAIGDEAPSNNAKTLAKKWKKYGAHLSLAGKVAGYARSAVSLVPVP